MSGGEMGLNKIYPYEVPKDAIVPEGMKLVMATDDDIFTTFGCRRPEYRESQKGVTFYSRTPIHQPGKLKIAPEGAPYTFAVYDQGWKVYDRTGPVEYPEAEEWEDGVASPVFVNFATFLPRPIPTDDEEDKSPYKDSTGDTWLWDDARNRWYRLGGLDKWLVLPSKAAIKEHTG